MELRFKMKTESNKYIKIATTVLRAGRTDCTRPTLRIH